MRHLRVLLAALVVAVLSSPAEGQEARVASFLAFEGRTDSYAAGLSTKQLAAAPLPVEAFLTRTRTEVNSQPRAQAYAGVVDVPLGELLGIFGFPTQLPTYCYANYPGQPESTCGVPPPTSELPAEAAPHPRTGQGRTHVEGDGFNLDATAAESSVSAGSFSSEQLTVEASTSRSVSHIVDGVLTTRTEVVLEQVDVAGALAFEQMRTLAVASTDGRPGGAQSQSSLTVSGVSVMGEAVPTPDEVDLATLSREVLTPFSEVFATQGLTLEVLEPPTSETTPDGRRALASVGGLRVETSEPGTGNRVGVTLGVALASAVATLPSEPVEVPEPAEPPSLSPAPPPAPAPSPPSAPAPDPPAPVTEPPSAAPDLAGRGLAFTTDPTARASEPAPPGPPAASAPATAPERAAGETRAAAPALATEVLGDRVTDRLPVLYAGAAAGILALGLLGFGVTRAART